MRYFIEKGFTEISCDDGSTALHNSKITRFDHFSLLYLVFTASSEGHLDIVKYFIENGFDRNIKNKNGSTALQAD